MNYEDSYNEVQENNDLIVELLTGSHLYGTNVEGSDVDFAQVRFTSRSALLGMGELSQDKYGPVYVNPKPKHTINGDKDVTVYTLNHLFKLLAKGAPNVSEFLFAPHDTVFAPHDNKVLYLTRLWEDIVANRDRFITKQLIRNMLAMAGQQRKSAKKMLESNKKKWKMMGHALRVSQQAQMILDNGYIKFPLPFAMRMTQKSIKSSNHNDFFVLDSAIELAMGRVESRLEKSDLPERSNIVAINAWLEQLNLDYLFGDKYGY